MWLKNRVLGMRIKVKKLAKVEKMPKSSLKKIPRYAAEIEMAIRTKAGLISKKIEGQP